MSPRDALDVLSGSLRHPAHRFWTEDIAVADALAVFGPRLLGHQQITDAYLLGLAIHKKGRLATFDSSVSSLLPDAERRKIPARVALKRLGEKLAPAYLPAASCSFIQVRIVGISSS